MDKMELTVLYQKMQKDLEAFDDAYTNLMDSIIRVKDSIIDVNFANNPSVENRVEQISYGHALASMCKFNTQFNDFRQTVEESWNTFAFGK